MGIKLTDLIEVSVLQKLLDSFSAMTGMAALVTDEHGTPITSGSGFSDFCMKYTRKTKVGNALCRNCDCMGAKKVLMTKKSATYYCHAGLIDFAAPIMVNETFIGCIIGGQVLSEPPRPEVVSNVAAKIGVDFNQYWKAALRVPIFPVGQIQAAADFIFTMANILSDIAYSQYITSNNSKELERVSDLKSDFLASMSHEIRTPMNAVIGMTEMALREDLPENAKNYIMQIKSSSKILLGIINDILDFSKIESGKMDIIPAEYDMVSLCQDVSSIIETRIKDKRIELFLSINPKLPSKLYGDGMRVRQILINLANNAAKFTQKGMINISIDYGTIDAETIRLKMKVTDTGCGIRKKDMEKIFDSFQQVDSKRNRGAEGTGLGLAICRRLLELMGGTISVSSQYEKGSVFSVELPQKVLDRKPAIQLKNKNEVVAIGYFQNRYIARQFFEDTKRLGVLSIAMIALDRIEWGLEAYAKECAGKKLYLFADEHDINDEFRETLKNYPDITVVELVSYLTDKKDLSKRWRVARKPLSVNLIATILDEKEFFDEAVLSSQEDISFTAPEAKVLVVDDNAINLTVTEGLLEPLHMKVYTATSGLAAIDFLAEHPVDLIFMDHMMPELDGIETTRIIRRFHPEYDHIPIIALTANVVEDMEKVFLSEGMNDFVSKPIEVRLLIQKVKQWLPPEKITKKQGGVAAHSQTEKTVPKPIVVGDLDTEYACRLLGSEKLFWKILKDYYENIPQKAKKIERLFEEKNIEQYTIEVHSLKSTSRQIGAMQLADLAEKLEKAGHQKNTDMIAEHTRGLLKQYTDYIPVFAAFFPKEAADTEAKKLSVITASKLQEYLEALSIAADDLDIDCMEQIQEQMNQYQYESEEKERFQKLCEAIHNIDVEACMQVIEDWKSTL